MADGFPRMSLDSLSPLWILLAMGLGREYLIPDYLIQINLTPSRWFLLLMEVKFCPTQGFSTITTLAVID